MLSRLDKLIAAARELAVVESMAVRERSLDEKTAALGATIEQLEQLPSMLGEKTSQYIAFGVKHSVRDDFERPIAEAVKGPLAQLSKLSYDASEAMRQVRDESRHQTWRGMASLVLLGIALGVAGIYLFFQRDIGRIDGELDSVRQQMIVPAVSAQEVKPVPATATKRVMGIPQLRRLLPRTSNRNNTMREEGGGEVRHGRRAFPSGFREASQERRPQRIQPLP